MTIADKLALLEQTKEAQRVKLGLPESLPFSEYVNFLPDWSPSYLFRSNEQGVWFDPSDLSTMFQDVDGLEPVTKDGDPVALIKDKSGNDNHAIQEKASARPIYRTDGNLHWLEFDGVDDYLVATGLALNTSDYLFAVGMKYYKLDYAGHSFATPKGQKYLDVYHGGNSAELTRFAVVKRYPSGLVGYDRQGFHPAGTRFTYRLGKELNEPTGFLKVSERQPVDVSDVKVDAEDVELRLAIGATARFGRVDLYSVLFINNSHVDSGEVIDDYLAIKAGITL